MDQETSREQCLWTEIATLRQELHEVKEDAEKAWRMVDARNKKIHAILWAAQSPLEGE